MFQPHRFIEICHKSSGRKTLEEGKESEAWINHSRIDQHINFNINYIGIL